MATDYDEVRSDVKESQDNSLEALKSASAPDARSVVTELDEADALDEGLTPGGEIVAEELIVQVIPQGADEFTCSSCFLVRHRSQLAREQWPVLLHRVRRLTPPAAHHEARQYREPRRSGRSDSPASA